MPPKLLPPLAVVSLVSIRPISNYCHPHFSCSCFCYRCMIICIVIVFYRYILLCIFLSFVYHIIHYHIISYHTLSYHILSSVSLTHYFSTTIVFTMYTAVDALCILSCSQPVNDTGQPLYISYTSRISYKPPSSTLAPPPL